MSDSASTKTTGKKGFASLAIAGIKQKQKKKKDVKQPPGADVRSAFDAEPPEDNGNAVLDDGVPKEPLVIPAVPNKFGITASKKKESTPQLSQADQEALEALQAQADEEDGAATARDGNRSKDMIIQATQDTFQRETQQFKADLEELPDELDSAEYARRVPIADFGAAMLRGMGWQGDDHDSQNNNLKNKKDEVMPRPQRLGLGAVPKMQEMPQSIRKRALRPDQLKQRERLEQQQKEFAAERERQVALDKQRTLQDGSLVALRSGGRAKVVKLVGVPGLNMVKIWKEGDGETSVVKRGEIVGLLTRDQLENKPYQYPAVPKETEPKKSKESETVTKDRRRKRDGESRRDNKERPSKRSKEEPSSSRRRMTWVIPNIRVRIVTERLGRKYFKEKGIVVDVTSKGATLRLDKTGTVLDRVLEDYLETALPKPGGKAIVLTGRNKYAKGKLLERNSKSGKGSIQIFEDMSVLALSLDDLAEYVGSLDDDVEE